MDISMASCGKSSRLLLLWLVFHPPGSSTPFLFDISPKASVSVSKIETNLGKEESTYIHGTTICGNHIFLNNVALQ
ncbi:hypothetical protein L6452_11187 [Arctium lappa]|uniref:Uncharacterized protein n=1 Tax=Arctium lappa TaxID=4217 RepID=A0ACB9DPK2_ARCLA|nr:hypothetical protein L6452_11187 [Arctium lappa]